MRAASTAVSLTTHVVLVVAALWATADGHPPPPRPPIIIELPPGGPIDGLVRPAPEVPHIDGEVVLPPIEIPTVGREDVGVARPVFDARLLPGPVVPGTPLGAGDPLDASLVEQLPVRLAGPVPAYPELLRQAGVQGRVVLEAVVDTAGRVESGSILVVSAAHPGLGAPARQALAATLFRPARVRGRAVRVRVRIPMDFVLRR